MTDIDITIPDFLRVKPGDAERRKKAWEGVPLTTASSGGMDKPPAKDVPEDVARFAAIQEEVRRQKQRQSLDALRVKKGLQPFYKPETI